MSSDPELEKAEPVEVLVLGAHPDDAELAAGGMMHKLAAQGVRVGILDLTRGELGTRGSAEERTQEAANAARVLGVTVRLNLDLPDGGVRDVPEQRLRLITFLRKLRPRILVAHWGPDRHPDHTAAHAMVRAVQFQSGLPRIETGHPPHRPDSVYFYHAYTLPPNPPTFVVDISEHFETKLEALRQFRSQFHNPDYEGEETMLSTAAFWKNIDSRAAYWGERIGAAYGEPFYATLPIELDLLGQLR